MISNNVYEVLEFRKILDSIAKYAVTELGKEIVTNISPFDSTELVKQNGDLVSEAKEILIQNDIPPLESIPNLHNPLSRSTIENSLLTIKDIRDIYNLAVVSRKVKNFILNYCADTKLAGIYSGKLFSDKILENEIDKIFDTSGDIKDSASTELKRIRRSINERNEVLRKSVNRILKSLSASMLVQEEYVTMRDGRVVLPIKAENKRKVKGFIHSESATGQTIYIEPEETLELNNDLLSLRFAEKREIEKILGRITERIGKSSFLLKNALIALSEIDAIFSKAKYSIEIIGSFPNISEYGKFKIINGFHPILLKKIGRKNTVPLNIEIKDDRIIIITGPNAGGKTVVLKTVGLLLLMVKSGIHVPVDPDSDFVLFENIFLDIGDQQSLEDDLSTFSSHLSNINKILLLSDDKTIVLIDELGTGTDPTEGIALSAAILNEFKKINSVVLATTHHGDLKILANNSEGFQNASMEFDVANLKPTYRFKQGLPGSSYAFEVAKRIGIDEEIISSAKEILKSDENKIEDFLVDLERKTNLMRKKLSEYEIENSRLKGLSNLYQSKINTLEKEKKEIIRNAKAEASSLLSRVNKEVESTIKDIKEGNAERSVIKKAKRKIEKLKKESKPEQLPEVTRKKDTPKINDWVKIIDTTTIGKIISISGNVAQIVSGNIKVKAKLNRLEIVKKPKKKEEVYRNYNVESLPGMRIDIRGSKPEEIEFDLVRFLDNAYSSNLKQVEIVHGKGTGVLKNMVIELLRKHDGVKDFGFAKIEFGGEGITIANLN